MEFKEEKSRLRAQTLKVRDALATEARIEKSLAAAEHGSAALQVDPGTVVSGFFPIRSEIDPRPFVFELQKRGVRLCLPVVMDRETIVFRELVRGAELIDTGFGTRGPGPDAAELDPEILVMPLSVFDHYGGRIGYGAGHYDRAIARLLDKGIEPFLLGMGFDCQHHELVPVEDHDQPLNAMVTESGYYPAKERT